MATDRPLLACLKILHESGNRWGLLVRLQALLGDFSFFVQASGIQAVDDILAPKKAEITM